MDTDSEVTALQRAQALNAILENFWVTVADIDSDDLENKYARIVAHARVSGFRYMPAQDVAGTAPISEVINRVDAASVIHDETVRDTILGGVSKPEISLSKARDILFEHEQGNLTHQSEGQIRKWKNPRKKAVANFVSLIGDKAIENITRQDIAGGV